MNSDWDKLHILAECQNNSYDQKAGFDSAQPASTQTESAQPASTQTASTQTESIQPADQHSPQ